MKAYLINPFYRTVEQIEYNGDWRTIPMIIGCEMFCTTRVNAEGDLMYLDDVGLYANDQQFFRFAAHAQPLAGKGLVLGHDEMGDCVDATISIEDLRAMVDWMDHDQIREEAADGAFNITVSTLGPNMEIGETVSRKTIIPDAVQRREGE